MAAVQALESTLRRNDDKPDWLDEEHGALWFKLEEELAELSAEYFEAAPNVDRDRLQAEALDLALCALFIWQGAGGCPDFGHRGGLNLNEGMPAGGRHQGGNLPK